MSNKNKRDKIFGLYAKRIKIIPFVSSDRVAFHMVDAYICPLCLSVYSIGNTDLMLAHVPPESIGGKPILVTCKDCNSNRGTDISLFQQACNSRILHKFVGRITNKQ